MTLLIVDDEKYILENLAKGCDWFSLGFDEVLKAKSALKAIEIFNENKIDVLITDICMPKMSGIDLVKRVSELSPDTITIVLSGYAEFEYSQSALRYGVFDYLLKPVKIEVIEETVKNALKLATKRRHELTNDNDSNYDAILKKEFLYKLINDPYIKYDYIEKKIKQYSIEVLMHTFFIVVFSFGKPNYDTWRKSDLWLIKYGMDNILNELCENDYYSEIFDARDNCIVMFISNKNGVLNELSKSFCEGCCEILSKTFELATVRAVISPPCDDVLEIQNTYKLLHQYSEYLLNDQEESVVYYSEISSSREKKMIKAVREYLDEHLSECITVNQIASIVNFSPNYFSSLFKMVTGKKFVEYLNEFKINEAKKKLSSMDISISEIASLLGYNDEKYFSRVFKRYVGLTPHEYRRQWRNKND